MSRAALGLIHKHPYPLMIVISGPSGVGKDSVVQRMKERQLPFHFVVTATSRAARPEETHGVDYFFVSEQEFERMIAEDELIEHAWVYEQYKGIPKQQVRDAFASGLDVVLRLDVQGAATIREKYPQSLSIFITTETEEELVTRLRNRKTDTEDALNVRINTAKAEYQRLDEFDYVVYNRELQLDEAVDDVIAIIMAEHRRVAHRQVTL